MKTVIWIGASRIVPKYGMTETGREITLPVKIADSFIKQGLAEKIKVKTTRKTEETG